MIQNICLYHSYIHLKNICQSICCWLYMVISHDIPMKNLTYLVIKSFSILHGERAAYLSEEFQGVLQENLQERLTMSWQLQETMATITYGISYCISYGTTYGMYIIVYIYIHGITNGITMVLHSLTSQKEHGFLLCGAPVDSMRNGWSIVPTNLSTW